MMRLSHPPGSCVKRGVILTCYVNGRKRFRCILTASAKSAAVSAPDGHAARTIRP